MNQITQRMWHGGIVPAECAGWGGRMRLHGGGGDRRICASQDDVRMVRNRLRIAESEATRRLQNAHPWAAKLISGNSVMDRAPLKGPHQAERQGLTVYCSIGWSGGSAFGAEQLEPAPALAANSTIPAICSKRRCRTTAEDRRDHDRDRTRLGESR